MNKIKLFCLLGLPGVGKGTLAAHFQLSDRYQKISTGDIFREEAKKDTENGRTIKSFLDRGFFIPDNFVCDTVKQYLDALKRRNENDPELYGIIFDGFPRSLIQADFILNWAEDNGDIIDFGGFVLITNVINSDLAERLEHRLTCSKCGMPYFDKNLGYEKRISAFENSPLQWILETAKENGNCLLPWCNGKLYRRNDDSSSTLVANRTLSMSTNLPSICMAAAKKGLLHVVDGSKSPLDIYRETKYKIDYYKIQ